MIEQLVDYRIEALLKGQMIGNLACYADGVTYVVPMSFTYDGEYIYGRSDEGMKINMMRKNPKVCFQVLKMENMANWESAIVWGTFEELTDATERNKALQKLMDRALPMISSETVHFSPQWPFPPQDIGSINGIVFRVKVSKKTGRFEKTKAEFYFAS